MENCQDAVSVGVFTYFCHLIKITSSHFFICRFALFYGFYFKKEHLLNWVLKYDMCAIF